MKKTGIIPLILTIVIAGVFAFGICSSCFLTNSEEDTITAPTVAQDGTSSTTYDISFAPQSNMVYANIFRQSCSAEDFSGTITTVNAGQIVPVSTSSLPSAFIFYDWDTSTALYYRYYVRFWTGSSYSYTEKSDINAGLSTSEASLSVSSPAILYSCNNFTKSYTFTLSTDVTMPNSNFTALDVIISNGTNAKLFGIGTASSLVVSSGTVIDLQKLLPSSFLDTSLTLVGLTGVYTYPTTASAISALKYTEYYCTDPTTSVTVYEKLTDSTGTVDSIYDGTSSSSSVESFTVPTPVSVDNGTDYTPSSSIAAISDVLSNAASYNVSIDMTPEKQ